MRRLQEKRRRGFSVGGWRGKKGKREMGEEGEDRMTDGRRQICEKERERSGMVECLNEERERGKVYSKKKM